MNAELPRHFVIGPMGKIPEASIMKDGNSSMNNNDNNVDADREMSLLAENQLRYNSYLQAVNEQIRMMRWCSVSVISPEKPSRSTASRSFLQPCQVVRLDRL